MSLNNKEINLILEELSLTGSFIQQIIQPNFESIALYTYKNGESKTVYICLAPGACRLHQTNKKIPKSEKPLRFNEFLKSRIKGSKILSCEQLGKERIIKMELGHGDEQFCLFIRLWSGAANIIVTDTNLRILDVFFRRPKRNEISGQIFVLPEINNQDENQNFAIRSFTELQGNPLYREDFSFNEKVDLWYNEHGAILSREAILQQAEKIYQNRKKRMELALEKLQKKRESFLQADFLKHQGDLILSYGHLLSGDKDELVCIDYETDAEISIPIDAKKSVQENAQLYYEKYKKAVSGLEELEYDIQKAKKELLDLDANYELLIKEPNTLKMHQIFKKQNKPKQQIAKKHPGISYHINGWHILVGRTASENDELLRRHVKGQDMWLHTRDYPGGYVFIKHKKDKTIPLDILLYAGNLAVFYSKARKNQRADLYYTQVKHLRRAKNGPKGKVLPSQEKNLTITLDSNVLKKLEEAQV